MRSLQFVAYTGAGALDLEEQCDQLISDCGYVPPERLKAYSDNWLHHVPTAFGLQAVGGARLDVHDHISTNSQIQARARRLLQRPFSARIKQSEDECTIWGISI